MSRLFASALLKTSHKIPSLCDNFLYLHDIPKLSSHLELTLYFSIQSILNVFHSLIFLDQKHLAAAQGIYTLFIKAHKNYIGSIFTNQQGFK